MHNKENPVCISTMLQYALPHTFPFNFTGFPDNIVQKLSYLSHWKSVVRWLNVCKSLESYGISYSNFSPKLF